jgi:hypothetical protein
MYGIQFLSDLTNRNFCSYILLLNLIVVQTHTGRQFSLKENLAKNFCILRIRLRNLDTSVGIATGLKARVRVPVGKIFSLLHSIPYRLRGPSSLLSVWYGDDFYWGKAGGA